MAYNPNAPVATNLVEVFQRIAAAEGGTPTPTPTPSPPSFTTPASINSDGTPQVGEQLTGIDGVVANGSVTARAWLLGSTTLATTALYTPTQTGVHTYRVTATGTDGTPIDSSSSLTVAAASVSSAFTMTQLAAPNRTYQRATTTGGGQGKGTGTIPVAINVTTPGSVFARIRSEADGSILQAAFALTSTTATGAQTINVPGVDARTGWLYVDLAPSASGPWQNGTVRVGMGRLIGISGQSQAVRQIAKMPTYAGTNASLGVTISPNASVYARYTDDQRSLTTPAWALPADGGNYDSTFAAEFLRLQVAAFGVNCGLVGHAVGATNIASWQPGQANFTNLSAVLDAVGGFEAFHEHIGGNDAGENTSYADFQTRLGTFFSGIADRNAVRGTNFQKIVTTMATRTSGGAGTVASVTNIRKAGKDWAAANGAIYAEPHTIVLEDPVHQGQPGSVTLARSLHRATTTSDIGPAIASGTRVGLDITIPMTMQTGAAPLVRAGNPVSRFSVFASGTMTSALALSSITVNASSIVLTLSSDPGNAAALDVYALLHPDPSQSAAASDMIYDSRVDGDGIATGRALVPSITPIVVAAPGGGTPTPTPTARMSKMMFREPNNTDVIAGYNRINLKTADNVTNANTNISKALLDTADQATGLTVNFSNVQGINDVGQTPGDGTLPDAVLQKSFFNGASPAGATNGNVAIPSTTVTISGATVGREYTLRALSSRAVDPSRPTRYTASGKAAQDLEAGRNIKNFVTIGAGPILPNSSGVLSFTFEPALGSSSYAYLNYLEVSWTE